MAIRPSDEYAGQITTGDGGYPHGKAKNVTVPGDGTGTPLEERWVNDHFGFQQALLARAGILPSGSPDEVGASDYLDALLKLFPIKYVGNVLLNNAAITHTTIIGPSPNVETFEGNWLRLEFSPDLYTGAAVGTVFATYDSVFDNFVAAPSLFQGGEIIYVRLLNGTAELDLRLGTHRIYIASFGVIG